MATKRNKLIHIHSNVYSGGKPQAPQSGVLNKGEIAVNYNDTEPALFIENNSGQVVKFNAITNEKISQIEGNVSSLSSDLGDVQSNNKIVLNGTEKSMTGSTWSFYAPTASGAAGSMLVSDGASKSPKWVAQSGLTAGTADEAKKTTGKLTISTNGTQKAVFNGSADTSVNITAGDVGAAAANHSHDVDDLPTASTTAYGVTKLGTAAGTAAEGNHTHSAYVNPTVTNCGQTLSWGTQVTAATIGSTAITVKGMAKPTPSEIGAATANHSHDADDLPVATTSDLGVMKVGSSLSVSDGTVRANTASTSGYGVVKIGSGLVNGSGTSAGTISVATANTTDYGVVKAGNFIGIDANGIISAKTGTTSSTLAVGNHSHTPAAIGAAPASHSHEADDLPTASTTDYGIVRLGSGSGDAAVGNHTHSAYVNPTVTNCGQTLSWGSEAVVGKIGSTSLTVKAMAKPTAAEIGAASANHSHDAEDLPTASTADYGVMKVGSSLGVTDGIVNASTATTTSFGVVKPGSGLGVSSGVVTVNTATSNTYGIVKAGNFVNISSTGVISVTTGTSASSVAVGNHSHTPASIGAAAENHSHDADSLPTASTTAYGITKLGTGSGDAAAGNHTHSAYVNPTVTNCAQTLSWGTQVTAATIGSTALTIKAMAKPTPADIGAAAANHSHDAEALPTASTTAYGITKLGTAAGTAAEGNHTHSAYVNPTVTNCAQTLSWGTQVTAATIGSTALTIKAMAKPTPADIGAAPATHSHDAAALPTASTTAYGVIKIGSAATDAAAGNHTHSAYVNPTVTNCGQTLSWGTEAVVGKIGSTSLTVKAMAKPTPGEIGAAASSHSHAIGDLPTEGTLTNSSSVVPTSSAVKAYVDGLVASPVNYKGAVTTGAVPASGSTHVGDMYIVQTSSITLTTATSATGAAQTAETGDYIIARSANKWDVMQKNLNGAVTTNDNLTADNFVLGNGTQTVKTSSYNANSFAPKTHSHDASALPTASTTAYGIIKIGTAATDAAAGNHSHSAYVNPTVTNCAQTLSWNTTVTAATIGNTALTIKAMAKPTPADIGAAAASHSHDATQLPTASTSAYGVIKIGTAATDAAAGNHSHSAYVNPTVTNCAQTLSWNTTVTAATIGNTALTIKAMAKPTPADIGAATASHSHDAAQLPTAATNAFGVIKVGTSLGISNGVLNASTATTDAFGVVKVGSGLGVSNGTISVNTASTSTYGIVKAGSFISISTGGVITVATGTSSTTVARGDHSHTPAAIGAAPATHSHEASALPTASTTAYGIIKIGTAATDAAAGNHTHSAYVNPTVTNCAQTLSWNTTVTAATIGSTSLTIKAMAKPTPDDIGAAPATHSHDAAQLPTASTTAYGVMKVGTSLGVSNGVVNASTATTSAFGVVKIGSSLSITNGVLSATTATTSAFGVIKPGSFLSISSGVLTVSTGTSSSTIARGDHTHTPASIGAAAANHGHDASDIDGTVSDSDKVDGYHVSVVTSMPSSPNANTIYILK